jgi:hypothetical protein
MKNPVLWAAVLAALPPGALAQEGKPASAAHQPDCTEAPRAASALPARASTQPEPQQGTVAPNTHLPPSHTVTPSSRAMAAATARAEKTTNEEKNVGGHCADGSAPGAPESGRAKPAGT